MAALFLRVAVLCTCGVFAVGTRLGARRTVRPHDSLAETRPPPPSFVVPVAHSFLLTNSEAESLLEQNHIYSKRRTRYLAQRSPLEKVLYKPSELSDEDKLSSSDADDDVTEEEADEKDLSEVIIPMNELRHNHFVGTVSIGSPPQKFQMIFDTGSTNVQVVGNGCLVPSCMKVSRFDPDKSSTFEWVSNPPVSMDITFGTGKIHTRLGSDVMAVGPYKVDHQTLGVIDRESAGEGEKNVFDRIEFEGMVGFGFPSMASAGHVPFFDNLMNSPHAVRQFAIYMGPAGRGLREKTDTRSAFFIDGQDDRFFKGPLKFVPVSHEHYWQTELKEFWVGDAKFCCDENTTNYVIIDSGTTYNTLPYGEIVEFHRRVPSVPCQWDDPNFLPQFPTLRYVLTDGVEVVLTPEMYIASVGQNDGRQDMCRPAFMQIDVPSNHGHSYLLGSLVFMRNYFTVFRRGVDGQHSQIGIAPAIHSDENTKFLESFPR